jgi:uncharacterized protein
MGTAEEVIRSAEGSCDSLPRIVYLHGFASSPASKKACFFRERFAQLGIELEIPDLAERNFERLTITGQLAVIERVTKRVPQGERVSLIGSSLGGYLAALYASRHPEIEKLVLMAPAFCFARRWSEALGPERVEEWKRSGWLPVFHYGEGETRRLGYQLAEDGLLYPDFPNFTQRALIFHGSHDTSVPPELSEQFATRHANVHLEIFDSDHELVNVLEPMWERTREFLISRETTAC